MKNYLVIGASSGIGKQLAMQLAGENARVFGTYFKNEIQFSHPNISFHQLNVLDENPDFSFLSETLDGLAYCPGSINLKSFNRLAEADFSADWQINFMGAVKSIQAVLPRLKRAGQAGIVLFSTVAVGIGMPFHASVAGAKGALEGLTRALAAEFAPRIRVNCIAPSLTETPLAEKFLNTDRKKEGAALRNPMQRIGQPEDVAEIASFLLSEKSSWMTGQIIHTDGGMSSLKI